MKTKVFIALSATFVSLLLQGYLALDYYPLKLGFASTESLCKVSEKLDCQAVAASPFAAIAGVPISLFGFTTQLVLFVLVLLAWWRLAENPDRMYRIGFVLSAFSLGASIVMGTISATLMTVYCLFCIFLYLLSAVTFESLRRCQTEVQTNLDWLKGAGIALFIVPIGAYMLHIVMLTQYGAEKLQHVTDLSVADWQSAKPVTLSSVAPMITYGPERAQAKMVITEFADFRCSHCKSAAPSLAAFKKSHPDVRTEFYAFPLDGQCNKVMDNGDGVSCTLAKSVICAETQNHGWLVHDLLFANFDEIVGLRSADAVTAFLERKLQTTGIDWKILSACLTANETHERIVAIANKGVEVGVQGTPTLFVNDRKLSRGQLLPVLEKAYSLSQDPLPRNQ